MRSRPTEGRVFKAQQRTGDSFSTHWGERAHGVLLILSLKLPFMKSFSKMPK